MISREVGDPLWHFKAFSFLLEFTIASRCVIRFPIAELIEPVTTDGPSVEPGLSDGSDPVS